MDYNTEMVLQLAPSIHHQAAAMLSILIRYNWHQARMTYFFKSNFKPKNV